MLNARPSVKSLVGVLTLALMTLVAPAATAARGTPELIVPTVANPEVVCSSGQLPTRWADEFHPPNTVRVLRSKGPNIGRVETVNFWNYVGVVLRAEYSTGQDKPPLWMQVGALTVKQYAWYKAMYWGGGRVTFTNPDGVTTTTQCYDLKDTTADQIYKPQQTGPDGTVYPGHIPTPANLKAMRETWHLSMRKWMPDKLKSRLFLSGYRSGNQLPCGTDTTGFKIMQKSLRDCNVKGLTLEETLRRYFEDRLQLVDVRTRDAVDDNNAWRGDLGVLTSNGAWRLYKGAADGFTSGPTGSLGNLGTLLGQGMGDVTGAHSAGANDERLFADLIMLADDDGKKLLVARATGNGFDAPVATAAPAASERLVVGDFNGDLLTDAGFLSTSTAGASTLKVMLRQSGGSWTSAVEWWTGALDMAADDVFVAAGDVNGDGKADLVMRDGSDGYRVAASYASCANFSNWGPCLNVPGTGLGAAAAWLGSPSWALADAKHTMTDFDRDGRDDVVYVTPRSGGGVRVMALRATTGGSFANPVELWQSSTAPFADVAPLGMHVDADGLGDLAVLQELSSSTTKIFWLRSVEKGVSPASMTASQSLTESFSWSGARPF